MFTREQDPDPGTEAGRLIKELRERATYDIQAEFAMRIIEASCDNPQALRPAHMRLAWTIAGLSLSLKDDIVRYEIRNKIEDTAADLKDRIEGSLKKSVFQKAREALEKVDSSLTVPKFDAS